MQNKLKCVLIFLLVSGKIMAQESCYLTQVNYADGTPKDNIIYSPFGRPLLWQIGYGQQVRKISFEHDSLYTRMTLQDIGTITIGRDSIGRMHSAVIPSGIYNIAHVNNQTYIWFSEYGSDMMRRPCLVLDYEGENIRKATFRSKNYSSGGEPQVVMWEALLFDDKTGIFSKEMRDYALIISVDFFMRFNGLLSLNNSCLSNVLKSSSRNPDDFIMRENKFLYQYNEHGYPTKVTYTIEGDEDMTFLYKYVCK